MLLIANTLSVSTKYGGVIQRLFNTFDIFKVVNFVCQNKDIGRTNERWFQDKYSITFDVWTNRNDINFHVLFEQQKPNKQIAPKNT